MAGMHLGVSGCSKPGGRLQLDQEDSRRIAMELWAFRGLDCGKSVRAHSETMTISGGYRFKSVCTSYMSFLLAPHGYRPHRCEIK